MLSTRLMATAVAMHWKMNYKNSAPVIKIKKMVRMMIIRIQTSATRWRLTTRTNEKVLRLVAKTNARFTNSLLAMRLSPDADSGTRANPDETGSGAAAVKIFKTMICALRVGRKRVTIGMWLAKPVGLGDEWFSDRYEISSLFYQKRLSLCSDKNRDM